MSELLKEKGKMLLYGLSQKNSMMILILVGILLVVIAWPLGKREDKAENDIALKEDITSGNDSYGDLYAQQLEERLEVILSGMEGVGRVKVMITMSANEEKVVEKDKETSNHTLTESDSQGGERKQTDKSSQENTVTIAKGNGLSEPFVIQTKVPIPEGVLVVADGGDDMKLNRKITEAIQALFPIDAHKIKVVKMKSER